MKGKATIVLAEDEKTVLTSVRMALEAEGYDVRTYGDGLSALEGLIKEPADLGIFDIRMPRMDGVELLRRLRQQSTMPVIFLTSKDEEIDELFGFKMGADDYIAKPFSQRLLVERVAAVLRRAAPNVGGALEDQVIREIKRGGLKLDLEHSTCSYRGNPVTLTITEFLILQALAMRPGVVKTHDALMDAAYDDQVYIDNRTIDDHIKRLRELCKLVDNDFDCIETLDGIGYRWTDDGDEIRNFGKLQLNFDRMTAKWNRVPLELTALEFALLRELAVRSGKPCTREFLLQAAYARDRKRADNRAIDKAILRLRSKIRAVDQSLTAILTVRGEGYCYLEPKPVPSASKPRKTIRRAPH